MDLMRRMPPAECQQALASLLALLPSQSPELLSRVDQPLQVACDEEHAKQYLLCDYNRDGDSYSPPLEDGVQPSAELRKLEQEANEVFSIYRDQ
jgi:capping protein beta